MFERYKRSFMPDDDDTPGGPPVPRGETRQVDMPFDRDLRRRILGSEPLPLDWGTTVTDAEEPTGTPATPGTQLQVLGAWQRLKPAWRRQQATARKLRERSPNVKNATDILRTRLLQKLQNEGWRRIAVTAPTSGCGTTFMTLNLALSISAVRDSKTVLLDLNQRDPGLADALNSSCTQRISGLLGRQVPPLEYLQLYADNLAVGMNSDTPPDPAEILQSRSTAEALDEIETLLTPDVVLCDMPPLLEHDDTLAFLPRVDAVLLIADGTKTVGEQITECETLLEGRAPLLGVVLNRGRGPK